MDLSEDAARRWAVNSGAWRETAQIVSQWRSPSEIDPKLLRYRVTGEFWEILSTLDVTLIVGREYEHFLVGLSASQGTPRLSYLPMPHPSGVAVDHESAIVYIASTRNPNQLFDLEPVHRTLDGRSFDADFAETRPLVPVRSRLLPGALYLHDLALISGRLHANAVGENAVITISRDGTHREVWWPKCVERDGRPVSDRNYIQLNSIAAGSTIGRSYFTASGDEMLARRPGQVNYPVDRKGVLFSGRTREAVVRGLTRPHSARMHGGLVFVDNSGYGELVLTDPKAASYDVVAKLPGWTRGLCLVGDVAFVGTSDVIPRFRSYAPGLDGGRNVCGVHAVSTKSGAILGSLIWPAGNQIFAVEWLSAETSRGFPYVSRREGRREREFFSNFARGDQTSRSPHPNR